MQLHIDTLSVLSNHDNTVLDELDLDFFFTCDVRCFHNQFPCSTWAVFESQSVLNMLNMRIDKPTMIMKTVFNIRS